MAASSIAWMLLGRSSDLSPSARRGSTTLTGTTSGSGAVAAATRSASWRRRGATPMASSTTRTNRPMSAVQVFFDLGIEVILLLGTTAKQAVHDGHEEQRGERRHGQAADDGAAERGVLLAPLAEAERHRQHADDHGEGGHQDGAQARGARRERGGRHAPAPRPDDR